MQLQDDPAANYGALDKASDELSLRAVRADRNDSRAWRIRSLSLVKQGQWDGALEAIAEALRIDPYGDDALFDKAYILIATGRSAEALPILDQLIALSPRSPSLAYFHHHKCFANMHLGRYEQAVAACEKARALDDYWFFHFRLMAAYALSGDMAKAMQAKAEVLKRQPTISIARLRAMRASDHPVFLREREATFITGMRKAGIPEE